jgi:S1-C subfamily serine protease
MSDTTLWAFPSSLQPEAGDVGFDLERALAAVVRLTIEVPDDAFTAAVLGTERGGNGIVIRDDGLILTIGYLITEAETIWIGTNDGRVVAGDALGYDYATASGWCCRSARWACLRLRAERRRRLASTTR